MKKLLLLLLCVPLIGVSQKKQYQIKYVPYISQKPYYCAPASAEMVLKYYGINNLNQDDIAESDASNLKGTHSIKMTNFLNVQGDSLGFTCKRIEGDFKKLKKYLEKDMPIIVRQWSSLKKTSRHYRVVIGYDDIRKQVICHDPGRNGKNLRIPYKTFKKLWIVRDKNPYWSSKNLMIIIQRK